MLWSEVTGVSPDSTAKASPWALLKQPLFRSMWLANLITYVGNWANEVGAGWAMATMRPEPLIVSLVAVANSAPLFLLGLPAGALADIFDRRALILAAQFWLLLTAVVMAGLTYAGELNPTLLIFFSLSLGFGSALAIPTWQSIIPQLVKPDELLAAVTLNSLSSNIARAIGPAIAGLLVWAAGPWTAFAINALSFGYVFLTVARWKPQHSPSRKRESLTAATLGGLRYLRHSGPLRRVYLRAPAFLLPASAVWALMPVLIKVDLKLTATHYGGVLAAVGLGAILSMGQLKKAQLRLGFNRLLLLATLVFGSALAVMPFCTHELALCLSGLALGCGWLTSLSSFQALIQTRVPDWVRARALAVYAIVFFGCLSFGSLLWGLVAQHTSTRIALWTAAATMILAGLSTMTLKVPDDQLPDLCSSGTWPVPPPPLDQSRPVRILVEYRIKEGRLAEFLPLLQEIGSMRRRDGAYRWSASSEHSQPRHFQEAFFSPNWSEHVSMHERLTRADQLVYDRLESLLERPPESTFWAVHLP